MLIYRIITALVLIPIVIAALFLLTPLHFALATVFVCMLAAWEWGQFVGFKGVQRVGLSLFYGGVLAIMLYVSMPLSSELSLLASTWLWIALFWWLCALPLVLSYPYSARFWQRCKVMRLLFGFLIIIPFFWGILSLRFLQYQHNVYTGAWWLLYVMVLVWGADTGAYLFGRLWGKHKLAPHVSPKKTWEGLFGGVCMSGGITWILSLFLPLNTGSMQVTPFTLFLCSIVTIAASILGDLTESMFKREAGIKDSSQLIPGHGGVLDRIDSLTAAIPVFACLLFLSGKG